MIRLDTWVTSAVLTALALVGPAVPAAHAQMNLPARVRPMPGPVFPGPMMGPRGLPTFPPAWYLGYGMTPGYPAMPGYGGYAAPYGGTNYDPYGSYLRGAADVYSGQANFVKAREEAKGTREQARQERLKTRKMMFDEWIREQDLTPTPEQARQRQLRDELLRSVNGVSVAEVASGAPLNALLGPLAEMIDRDRGDTQPVPLDRDQVRRLNVTPGTGLGHAGLLRDGGSVTVPAALAAMAPAEEARALVRDLETFLRLAHQQAFSGGPVDAAVVLQLRGLARQLDGRLTRNVHNLDFAGYSEAKRFLRTLDEAVALLGRPDAGRWVSGQYAAAGATVQELVRGMAGRGMRFAPANPGDEPAYSAVHRAMAGLYLALRNPAESAAGKGAAVTSVDRAR